MRDVNQIINEGKAMIAAKEVQIAELESRVFFYEKSHSDHIWDKYKVNTNSNAAPPLGLIPRYFHREMRLKAIRDAILRYISAGMEIPKQWSEEFQELIHFNSNSYRFVSKTVLAEYDKTIDYLQTELEAWRKDDEDQKQQIQTLKDQNTDYLLKITADHKELTSLRTEIKHDNAIIDRIGEDLKHATEQYHVLRRLVIALLVIYGATVAVFLSLIYSLS